MSERIWRPGAGLFDLTVRGDGTRAVHRAGRRLGEIRPAAGGWTAWRLADGGVHRPDSLPPRIYPSAADAGAAVVRAAHRPETGE
jgi:hypothetical protein